MTKYFISNGKKQKGPFTIEELKNGNIKKSTLVWSEGHDDWEEAGNFIELEEIFKQQPPPLPKRNKVKSEDVTSSSPISKKEKVANSSPILNIKILKYSVVIILVIYVLLLIFFGGITTVVIKIKTVNSGYPYLSNENSKKISEINDRLYEFSGGIIDYTPVYSSSSYKYYFIEQKTKKEIENESIKSDTVKVIDDADEEASKLYPNNDYDEVWKTRQDWLLEHTRAMDDLLKFFFLILPVALLPLLLIIYIININDAKSTNNESITK